MVTQWSDPKRIAKTLEKGKRRTEKFQDINVHEGFIDTKLATCGNVFETAPILLLLLPILIVLNDFKVLIFHQIISCLPSANGGLSNLVNFLGPEHNPLGRQMNLKAFFAN